MVVCPDKQLCGEECGTESPLHHLPSFFSLVRDNQLLSFELKRTLQVSIGGVG
jgi:hypothetical protein